MQTINCIKINICESLENLLVLSPAKRKFTFAPTVDVRFNTIYHLHEKRPQRGNVFVTSNIKSTPYCAKYNVRLCFNEQRNCFMDYHQNIHFTVCHLKIPWEY